MSRRTLVLLSSSALLLALLVLLDRCPRPAPDTAAAGAGLTPSGARALPGLQRHSLTTLRLERRDQPALVLQRGAGQVWRRPSAGLAAPAPLVQELLSAVEFLQPLRAASGSRGRSAGLDPPALRLVLEGPTGTWTLELGQTDLSGQGQHARANGRQLVLPTSFGQRLERLARRLVEVTESTEN